MEAPWRRALRGLSMIPGAMQQAAVQIYECTLIYREVVLNDDGSMEATQMWYCVPLEDQRERQQDLG